MINIFHRRHYYNNTHLAGFMLRVIAWHVGTSNRCGVCHVSARAISSKTYGSCNDSPINRNLVPIRCRRRCRIVFWCGLLFAWSFGHANYPQTKWPLRISGGSQTVCKTSTVANASIKSWQYYNLFVDEENALFLLVIKLLHHHNRFTQ
jgi:hypothetical protein